LVQSRLVAKSPHPVNIYFIKHGANTAETSSPLIPL